jgi:cytochrome c oxidase subunit 1
VARAQPWIWFTGMTLFSTSYHIAGLRGLPRRVYSGTLTGEYGAEWRSLTQLAAAGGVLLFLSSLCYLAVVAATWLRGRRIEAPAFEFARPLRPVGAPGLWDRYVLWTVVAVLLVAAAYAYPLYHLLSHARYGSPPYQPF